MHYIIKDTDFTKILKSLMQINRIHKKNIESLTRFINAVHYISRSGCQWRLLPPIYGHWRSVHKRFIAWSRKSIWEKLFESLKIDPDLEWISIDSTIVRAHASAAGYKKNSNEQESLGRSCGGFSTKIHAVVDALGNVLRFKLTPGQSSDVQQALSLAEGFNVPILADKGYDSDAFLNSISPNSCIPPRRSRLFKRNYDKHLYKERHVVECFFGKIKHFRRVFSRYDKTASSYLSFLYFVGALVWIR